MTCRENTAMDCSERNGLYKNIVWSTVSLNVPEYKYEFKFDNLPYYQPKELCDYDGNIIQYDSAQDAFVAYKTKYDDNRKPSFVYENGETVPLYKVNETEIKPFVEDGLVQITDYNCGPAAALQTLELLECNNHTIIQVPVKSKELWYSEECCVDGDNENTDISNQRHYDSLKLNFYTHSPFVKCCREFTDRQISMMEAAGTTWYGTLDAKGIASALNKYFKEKKYIHRDINENRTDDMVVLSEKTIDNLVNGCPVIYMVNVKSLIHYNADNADEIARHYITAVAYKKSKTGIENDVITVIDPNYNYRKRGEYTVTLKELIHSMTQAGADLNGNFVFI
ncbi:MAG: hypothetical protein K0R07_134 [Sedimentibacter sp.]|jgi:hypothetical protein|nr:hypothetical protein [Sedimentibacter sp.]